MRYHAIAALGCVLLAGCSVQQEDAIATDDAEVPATQEGIDYAEAQQKNTASIDAPETPLPAGATSASASAVNIPRSIQGSWRETDADSVTAAECAPTRNGNFGKVLTVRKDGFSFFETGGRLLDVKERSANRIRATFDTSYADTPAQGEFVFDVQDGGKVLTMREYGDAAEPGPIRYLRCPS